MAAYRDSKEMTILREKGLVTAAPRHLGAGFAVEREMRDGAGHPYDEACARL